MKKCFAAALVCCLLFCFTPAVLADGQLEEADTAMVYIDGLLTCRGYNSPQGAMIRLEDMCAFFGVEAGSSYDESTGALSILGRGFSLETSLDSNILHVNERYIHADERFTVGPNGRCYFPISTVQRLFGMKALVSEGGKRIDLDSSEASLPIGGVSYYSDTFGADNVYWLEHIVNAEAAGQPLEGMVGVANVVLNRVNDHRYPDNVHDVVFDDRVSVQFPPTVEGTIYKEPSEWSIIAARLALEGYNTVQDAIFFIDPVHAVDSSWTAGYRFITKIGAHEFYK